MLLSFAELLCFFCSADGNIGLLFIGLFVVLLGCLFSWVGSFCLYGFGELIEQITQIAENTKPISVKKDIGSINESDANRYNDIENNPTSIVEGCFGGKFQYDNAYYADGSYKVLNKAIDQNISACIIHSNTKVIGNQAFEYCSKLTKVVIPNGVTTLGDYAFYACDGMESITIPNSVTNIGLAAFRWCKNLNNITYEGTEQELNALGSAWKEGISPNVHITFAQN